MSQQLKLFDQVINRRSLDRVGFVQRRPIIKTMITQYQYKASLLHSEQDKARMDLLRCSEHFENLNRYAWDESRRESKKKDKKKRYFTEMLQLQQKEEENSPRRTVKDSGSLLNFAGELPLMKQRSAKEARRYSTDNQNNQKIYRSCQKGPASHAIFSPTKNNLSETAFLTTPPPNLTKTRSKTVFIHMLKHKSTNLQPPTFASSEKTIHNLSAIKVRIMARKIQQSKNMNFTHQQLKSQLEKVTTTQEIRHRKEKSCFRQNKISLYQLLSKRRKFGDMAYLHHQNS